MSIIRYEQIKRAYNKSKNIITYRLDTVFQSSNTVRVIKLSLLYLGLWIFNGVINELICHLTISETALTSFRFLYILCLFVFLWIFLIYKLLLKGYRPSPTTDFLVLAISMIYFVLRFQNYRDGWYFINVGQSTFKYVDLLGITLIAYLLIGLIVFVWRNYIRKSTDFSRTPFVADDPISSFISDKLNYKARAETLFEFLKDSHFENSFSIGIVGPWGNGKSSLIELLERKMEGEQLERTIWIKFLPYLNHSETDIISEFFKLLSSKISSHNGKLASFILDYSDKLLKLYKDKNLKEFFTSKIPSTTLSSPSVDLYEKINSILKEMDWRFVIFIDDLDRLSSREVLQVLKLVRNTANFRNFIFVMALDKEYVLATLMKDNDITDHSYVDKFFQLEIYLPEIDNNQLKEDFMELLENSYLVNEKRFIDEVREAVYKTNNLFDDYISNYRGVKRLLNQLIFDYRSLPDELDTNDFLNYTYLKMTFPSAIKLLNNNWWEILPYDMDSRLRELKKAVNNEEDDQTTVSDFLRQTRFYGDSGRFNPNFAEYELTSHLDNENVYNEQSALSKRQKILLGKTFIALFGKENENPKYTSIKFGENLRKLLQQKNVLGDLTHPEFKNIISGPEGFLELKNQLDKGQAQAILDRIRFHSPENATEVRNIIESLLFIYDKVDNRDINTIQVLQTILEFIQGSVLHDNNNLWNIVRNEYLNKSYDSFRKLELLSFLKENENRYQINKWGAENRLLALEALNIYKAILQEKDKVLWSVDDYSFYNAYHNIRKFYSAEKINPLVIDFWENNEINILCAQMVEFDAFTVHMAKTSDHAATIFGSKDEYMMFVKHKISERKDIGLDEYLDFLNLDYLSYFSDFLRFDFKEFDLILDRYQIIMENDPKGRDDYQNVVEIFIESFSDEVFETTYTNMSSKVVPGFINNLYYKRDGRLITKLRFSSEYIEDIEVKILNHYKSILSRNKTTIELIVQDSQITQNEDVLLKLLSIQPEDY
ncbi:KAP family P-loop NTPase fold protein [Luteirhabdus pelagi]|uniref:KAP family P-loop NTPase fold protein n=1 Tax=Luteirhabdus pelagi TaxID=2792783 RepID=UPI00193A56E6|nr:P-loop NTPase fold protein [Luteirhabdus pelagi]